jgi:hypothetical protein
VGAADETGKLVVTVAGRAVCRRLDHSLTFQIVRVCTNRTAKTCSLVQAVSVRSSA